MDERTLSSQPTFGVVPTADLCTSMQVIDVRRAAAFAAAAELVEGAGWKDPAAVDAWAGDVDSSRPVVVYCVHGQEVSQSTALALRARGIDAHYLFGGIEAWKASGLPTQPKGARP